jgi:hypothetical protein
MPYEGKLVSVLEMLDILDGNGLTEAAAALQLERAIEEEAIELRLPDGTDDEGETLYCKMSPLGRSEVIAVLRSFPNRMRTPLIRGLNAPLEMIKAVRAKRSEFEAAFGTINEEADLKDAQNQSLKDRRIHAVRQAIDDGMFPPSTIPWPDFCDHIRDVADGWIDRKAGKPKRGFGERHIKRDVEVLRSLH